MVATNPTASPIRNVLSWVFGLLALGIGLVNTFWGNDPGFGLFVVLLAGLYFPPVSAFIKRKTSFAIPGLALVALAVFIIWAAVGVGELFDKIDLMVRALS